VQLVDSFDLKNGAYDYTAVSLSVSGATQTFADICFSPSGTAWARFNQTDPFTQLLTVPSFAVTNVASTLTRTVFVPPNGVARLGL
jgi:type IV fimbrial biogenesis protein FimT